MKRVLAILFVLAMVAAACGDDDTGSTTPLSSATSSTTSSTTSTTSTTTSTSTTTTTSTTTSTSTTTTTMPPSSSTPIDLAPSSVESTDPLETVLELDGVSLTTTRDGHVGFTFDMVEHGDPTAQLFGTPEGVFVSCSSFEADGVGLTQCLYQTPDGFGFEESETPEDFPPMTAWIPTIEVTESEISITVEGTTYTGTGLVVEDGPVMVAINPDGSLQNPITRRTGEITSAELFAELNA